MPKAQRIRRTAHHASAKAAKLSTANGAASEFSTQELAIESESQTVLAHPIQLSKKEKHLEKREAFLQRLGSTTKTFSKSHERRMKQKAKEQLAGETFDDLSSALASLEKPDSIPATTIAEAQDPETVGQKKPQHKAGLIGQGKSTPLSKAQRKRAFELERLRHPMILQNPEFSTNPFQTIRIHAQNTLLKHTPA